MAVSTTPLVTLEDLERMPDDGMHYELLNGGLMALPPATIGQCLIRQRIFWKLNPYVDKRRLGVAFIEAGFKLFGDSLTWVQPDLSFIAAGRKVAKTRNHYLTGAPDFAVEVASPFEPRRTLLAKLKATLAAGAKAVLVTHPKSREIHVHRAGPKVVALRETDTLTLPDVLPRWRCKVANLFEE